MHGWKPEKGEFTGVQNKRELKTNAVNEPDG